MASIKIRGRMYSAIFRVNGKQVERTTGVPVEQKGRKAKDLRAEAEQKAAIMEKRARGEIHHSAALDALRSVEKINGGGGDMPTVREYLTNYRGQAKASTEKNRQRAIKYFLEYLGKGADVRLDALSRKTVQGFLPWVLERVAVGTVKLYRAMLATAFNAAVDDELIPRSPMPRIMKIENINPEIKRDVVKRQPFTPDELSRIFYTFPQPWDDMALASFALGGLRLGEVCCLRWENVDFKRDVVTVETTKTDTTLEQVLPPLLKARLLARREIVEEAEPYIFPDMARRYQREDSSISSEFSALLRAAGIVRAMPETTLKGNRKKVNPLSFHSLRHSFCTLGRCDSGVVPDIMRSIVGHNSELIERGYTTANIEHKRAAVHSIMATIPAAPAE
mgnify:CR=1 FL=1